MNRISMKETATRIAQQLRAEANLWRANAEKFGTSAAWESADVADEQATRAEKLANELPDT